MIYIKQITHPMLNVGGGACIYYKNFRLLKERHSICIRVHQLRNENLEKKLCNFIVLYCSPNQSQDDFETFQKNSELNLDTILANNPFLIVVLVDFNVKSNLWCKSDKISHEGSKI